MKLKSRFLDNVAAIFRRDLFKVLSDTASKNLDLNMLFVITNIGPLISKLPELLLLYSAFVKPQKYEMVKVNRKRKPPKNPEQQVKSLHIRFISFLGLN